MNKRHRTFLAINIPHEIKRRLAGYEQQYGSLPARWTPMENLHVTLVFLGDLTDEELGQVCMTAKEVVAQQEPFEISFTNVGYGPDEKISFENTQDKPPRMLWASGEKSLELSNLKNALQQALLEQVHFVPDHKGFSPHITLARVNSAEWRAIEPEERPEVGEPISLSFSVESIEVMERELKRGGPQYVVVESMPFK